MTSTPSRLLLGLASASTLLLAAPGCDDAPEWARDAELAALTTCDAIEPTALVEVRRVSWWDTSLGLTFDGIHAEDLQACWIYEPLADGRGRATLSLQAAVWRPEPGERAVVRVDAAEVVNDHAEIQGGNGRLEFVLEGEELMSMSTNWATWDD
ncbi:MAG: hypothetical protein KC486_20960 [Myxococcales bacterium]|nr:hypothetical protein [Myxococcales bacterium]